MTVVMKGPISVRGVVGDLSLDESTFVLANLRTALSELMDGTSKLRGFVRHYRKFEMHGTHEKHHGKMRE